MLQRGDLNGKAALPSITLKALSWPTPERKGIVSPGSENLGHPAEPSLRDEQLGPDIEAGCELTKVLDGQ